MENLIIPINVVQPESRKRSSIEVQKRLIQKSFDDKENLKLELFHMVREGNIQLLQAVGDSIHRQKYLWKSLEDGTDLSLIHIAAINNDDSVLKYLIERQGLKVDRKDNEGNTAVHLAAKYGCDKAVLYLMSCSKLNIDAVNKLQKTPLHLAVKYRRINVTKILLQHGANIKMKDYKKRNIIHYAMYANNPEIIKALTMNLDMLKEQEVSGLTPLMIAATEGSSEGFKMALAAMKENGTESTAILNKQSNEGYTCLMLAISNKQTDIVKMCIKAGADVSIQAENGISALHLAASTNYEELFTLLKESPYKNWRVSLFDFMRNTPLHLSCSNNRYTISQHLIELGANVNLWNNNFITPLLSVCLHNRSSQKLKKQEIQQQQQQQQQQKQQSNDSDVSSKMQLAHIDLLLSNGANPLRRDKQLCNVLHIASSLTNLILLKHILQKLDKNLVTQMINEGDEKGWTPLHYAAANDNVEVCQLLIDQGADLMCESLDFKLPIHIAIEYKRIASLTLLGTVMTLLNQQNLNSERKSMLLACAGDSLQVVRCLMTTIFRDARGELSRHVYASDSSYRTPLMLAARKGHLDVVTFLLEEADASVEPADIMKNTALHFACASGSAEVVRLLLDYDAKLTLNDFDLSPLDLALMMEKFETAELFLTDERWLETLQFRHEYRNSHLHRLIETNEKMALNVLNRGVTKINQDKLDSTYQLKYDLSLIDPNPNDPSADKGLQSALMTMAKYKRSLLLKHPLSQTLLRRKWLRIGFGYFMLDLILYLVFLISLTIYVIINDPPKNFKSWDNNSGCIPPNKNTSSVEHEESSDTDRFLIAMLFIIITVRICVLIIRLLTQKLAFFKDTFSYLAVVLYVVCFNFIPNPSKKPCLFEWSYGAVAIFLAWFMLISYFYQLPLIGQYIIIFEFVLIRVALVLFLFMCTFIGFALGFFIVLRGETAFSQIHLSLMKTFGMMLGEFEISTYFLQTTSGYYPTTSVLIYLFFLIMPISLISLVVGISVGGIEKLQKEASVQAIITRIQYVGQIEAMLPICILRSFYVTTITVKNVSILKTKASKYW